MTKQRGFDSYQGRETVSSSFYVINPEERLDMNLVRVPRSVCKQLPGRDRVTFGSSMFRVVLRRIGEFSHD